MDQAIHDIAVLLNEMNEGRLRDETSRQLTDLVGYLHQHALDRLFLCHQEKWSVEKQPSTTSSAFPRCSSARGTTGSRTKHRS